MCAESPSRRAAELGAYDRDELGAQDLGAGHGRHAASAADAATPLLQIEVEGDFVADACLAAHSNMLGTHEVGDRAGAYGSQIGDQRAARLREGLEQEEVRDGEQTALTPPLTGRELLASAHVLTGRDDVDLIDEQKRIAMREEVLHSRNLRFACR